MLKRAFASRDPEILKLIKDQERKNGKEGLRDPNFRARLRAKLADLDSDPPEISEANRCESCDRRAQLSEREIKKLRAIIKRLEASQNPEPMQAQSQSQQGLMQMFAQMLSAFSGGGQQGFGFGQNQNFGFGQNFGNGQNYFAGRYQYRQAPAIAGLANYGSYTSYGQAPAIAGQANYSGITANHYSLINRNNAPAVLPYR